eukprot:6148335-Alexandrium_andersonii.AAC.1
MGAAPPWPSQSLTRQPPPLAALAVRADSYMDFEMVRRAIAKMYLPDSWKKTLRPCARPALRL